MRSVQPWPENEYAMEGRAKRKRWSGRFGESGSPGMETQALVDVCSFSTSRTASSGVAALIDSRQRRSLPGVFGAGGWARS